MAAPRTCSTGWTASRCRCSFSLVWSGPADQLSLFGYDEVVWNAGGRTLMLVGRAGSRNALLQMASNLKNGAE